MSCVVVHSNRSKIRRSERAKMSIPYEGDSNDPKTPGLKGTNTATPAGGAGVWGSSVAFDGIHGESQSNQHAGVSGINNTPGGSGVWAEAQHGTGVVGRGDHRRRI